MATITRQLRPDLDSGTTDGTTANKLVDSSQNFTTSLAGHTLPCVVRNTTDTTRALVTAIDSDTQLSLDADIMVSGESYVIGGDYTSVGAWQTDHGGSTDKDLVTNQDNPVLECYKGTYSSGGLNFIDETIVLTGWTCNATYYPTIRCPSTEMHDGTPSGSGFHWKGVGNTTVLNITGAKYIRLENLELLLDAAVNYRYVFQLNSGADNFLFSNCVFRYDSTVAGSHGNTTAARNGEMRNCLFHSEGTGKPDAIINQPRYSSTDYKNCAFSGNATYGLDNDTISGDTHELGIINCWSYDVDEFYDTSNATPGWASDSGGNASETYSTTAPPDEVGSSNYTTNIVSGDFEDAGNDDYSLSSSSNLIQAGINLYSDFTDDIIGTARVNEAFSIGPFHRDAAADVTPPVLSLGSLAEGSDGPTEVDVGFTSDEAGTYYIEFSANSSETNTDVKADAIASGVATASSQTIAISGWTPGSARYAHVVVEDAATNLSSTLSIGPLTTTAYASTATYANGTIPAGSIGHYASGTSDSGSATHLIDSGLVITDDIYNGLTLHNDTDTASVVINDSIASTDRLEFTTGSVDFTSTDDYRITATISNGDVWHCEGSATVSSGSTTVNWYIQSGSTYTGIYQQTITGLSEADGEYTTSLDANGVLILTAPDPATATPGGDVVGAVQTLITDTGATLTITLTNDTWIAAGTGPIGTTAQSNAIVAGITSAQSEGTGWNAEVRDALDSSDLTRTSDTVATLTIPATAGYSITADEFITATIPNAVLTTATEDVDSSHFSIRVGNIGSSGGWFYRNSNVSKLRKRRLRRGRR